MKLRIKGNSLRLRVTPSEMAKLQAFEKIEERIQFGAAPGETLAYSLYPSREAREVKVRFHAGEISVALPFAEMTEWNQVEQTGIYSTVDVGNGNLLDISIEKDFACLDREEDQADTFSNPHAGQTC